MYDIIIVGAGPAGLTSAIYGCRSMKKVLVLESSAYGGQIVNTLDIENYPVESHISGFDFADRLYNQAKELGAFFKFEEVIGLRDNVHEKEVLTSKNVYKAKTIILATGSKNRKLGLANEDRLIGKGLSYCATCDGAFYKNKCVAVQGGGNTALEDALYLSDICQTVYLIHRNGKFRAEASLVNKLSTKDNIKIIFNSVVTKLNAHDVLESIEVTSDNGSVQTICVDGLFVAIGRVPENKIFSDLIDLDDNGYIVADESCHTNVEGIFVAGDNRTKEVRQLVTATSDGAIAAVEAVKFINK